MTEKGEFRRPSFKDILINEAGNDIIIPISATYDKAVLHIGIGNRSGVTIEKPKLKQGKQLKTSVGHATRDLMEKYFPGELDKLQERKQMHRRERGVVKNAHQTVVAQIIKDATEKEPQLAPNIKVNSKGDTKELENAVKDEIANKLSLADHIEAENVTSSNTANEATPNVGLHINDKVIFADDPNKIEKLMAAAKELSEEALHDALSEMSAARPSYQVTAKDDDLDDVARKMVVTALVDATKELKLEMPKLALPQMYIKKLSNSHKKLDIVHDAIKRFHNHLNDKAMEMSTTAVGNAMLEMPPIGLSQKFIKKLPNAHKKMDKQELCLSSSCRNMEVTLNDTACRMSMRAFDEAEKELKLEKPPLASRQKYIGKLSRAKASSYRNITKDSWTDSAKQMSMTVLGESSKELISKVPPFMLRRMHIEKLAKERQQWLLKMNDVEEEMAVSLVSDAKGRKSHLLSEDKIVSENVSNKMDNEIRAAKELCHSKPYDILSRMSVVTNNRDMHRLDSMLDEAMEMCNRIIDNANVHFISEMPSLDTPRLSIEKISMEKDKQAMASRSTNNIGEVGHQCVIKESKSMNTKDSAMEHFDNSEAVNDTSYTKRLDDFAKSLADSAEREAFLELSLEDATVQLNSSDLSENRLDSTLQTSVGSPNDRGARNVIEENTHLNKRSELLQSTDIPLSGRTHVETNVEPSSLFRSRSENESRSVISQSKSNSIVNEQQRANNDNTVEVHVFEHESTSSEIDTVESTAAPDPLQAMNSAQAGTSNPGVISNLSTEDQGFGDYIRDEDDDFGIMKIFLSSDIHCVLNKTNNDAMDVDVKKDYGYIYFSLSNFIKY